MQCKIRWNLNFEKWIKLVREWDSIFFNDLSLNIQTNMFKLTQKTRIPTITITNTQWIHPHKQHIGQIVMKFMKQFATYCKRRWWKWSWTKNQKNEKKTIPFNIHGQHRTIVYTKHSQWILTLQYLFKFV